MRTRAPFTAALGTAGLLVLGACGGGGDAQRTEFLDRWDQEGPHLISDEKAFEAATTMCSAMDEGKDVRSAVVGYALDFMGKPQGEKKAQQVGKAMGVGVLTICPEHEQQLRKEAGLLGAE